MFGFVASFFLLKSSILASRRILIIQVEKIPKNPASKMRATLACLLTCIDKQGRVDGIFHRLYIYLYIYIVFNIFEVPAIFLSINI